MYVCTFLTRARARAHPNMIKKIRSLIVSIEPGENNSFKNIIFALLPCEFCYSSEQLQPIEQNKKMEWRENADQLMIFVLRRISTLLVLRDNRYIYISYDILS